MKAFFTKMSFPRAVILFCTLGSLVFGTLVYLRMQRLDQVLADLKRVPELVKEMHTDAYRLKDLTTSSNSNNLKSQSEPESYIRNIAGDGKINIGQVDINHRNAEPLRGVEDTIYKITPQTKSQRFTRGQIGNFLYKLEFDSPRVKVTRIKLTPYEKLSPGQVGKDSWVFEVELTTRTKQEPAAAKG